MFSEYQIKLTHKMWREAASIKGVEKDKTGMSPLPLGKD